VFLIQLKNKEMIKLTDEQQKKFDSNSKRIVNLWIAVIVYGIATLIHLA
jgi:hypothetical protein